tara:strand:- start:89 stop:427 length:339 start_codon:yes stop_codon:yes gene_type:complete
MEKSIFAKIIDRDLPADIVYEDSECLAFRDVRPVAPCHVLLIPKKILVDLNAAHDDDITLLGTLLRRVPQIAKQLNYDAYRVVINNGAGAGQTVYHLHIHIIAGRALQWPPG